MKCTSKKIGSAVSVLCMGALLLTGCGNQKFTMAYDPNYALSSYQMIESDDLVKAVPFASGLCVTAVDVKDGTDVTMEEACASGLFDLNQRNVIYAQNIHEQMAPASLTKVMTALIAIKYGNPDDVITVKPSVKITESGAQLAGFKEGDTLTLDQALHVLLINSANDAGNIIAEHIGGSLEGFAEMMNEEAQRIGATNSQFVNAHGLSADGHYVTAYDMYLIFSEAIKQEHFNEIIHMSTYSTVYHDKNGNEKELSVKTTNQYLNGNQTPPDKITIIGGKTGTTNAAGNCLIIYAKDTSGKPYVAIILRSSAREVLYTEMTDLLNEISN